MVQNAMRTVCTGTGWTLVGPGARIGSVQQFAARGGTLFPAQVRSARRLPSVQYWVTATGSFENTCAPSMTSVEIGVNRRQHTYLYAVSLSWAPLNAAPAPPPTLPCPAAKATRTTGRILRPGQFRAQIANLPWVLGDLRGLVPTSAWQSTRGTVTVTIFAGSSTARRLAGQGVVEVIRSQSCQPFSVSVDTTDKHTGPLTLTRVRGATVFFTYTKGWGSLSLSTHRFALHGRSQAAPRAHSAMG
ncbi:MAG: hypothetical protein JOZ41_16420 [Chloroflexi bacterium]|nr:hypothetical protein [Chloroflexota bacterium]